jgi:alcohol dehydrogenase
VPDPNLVNDTDMILRVTATAISESDLYIHQSGKHGQKPAVIGHEFMSNVEEAGSEVKKIRSGWCLPGIDTYHPKCCYPLISAGS